MLTNKMLTSNLKSLPRLLAGVVTKKQQHMQVWDAISYSTATPVFTGFRRFHSKKIEATCM
jgi:hypothetical protein